MGLVLKCSCKQIPKCEGVKTQDTIYGVGLRYHNTMKTAVGQIRYRCTICGNVRDR